MGHKDKDANKSENNSNKKMPSTEKKVENRGAHLRVPEHLKVEKKVYVPTGNPRGRKPGQKNKVDNRGAHLRVPDHLKKAKKVYVPTGNPRGRKLGQKNKPKEETKE